LVAGPVERVEQRVVVTVELERQQPEPFTQLPVECGGDPHPSTVEMELGEAVSDEQVVVHRRLEFVARQVVEHISEPEPRRDTDGSGAGGQ